MLFNDTRKRGKIRYHYGTKKKALQTIAYIRTRPYGEQIRMAQTMYHRAKYHAHQTRNMRESMKVYADYIRRLKDKKGSK
jgi:regulator of sirC expression with transglutaminase-like and TPR domain